MPDDPVNNWYIQLRKGMLELGILKAINGTRLYGYEIVKKLRPVDGLVISEGTVYPILSRLKKQKLVTTSIEESPEGPARKYYKLSARGKQVLSQMNRSWARVRNGIDSLGE